MHRSVIARFFTSGLDPIFAAAGDGSGAGSAAAGTGGGAAAGTGGSGAAASLGADPAAAAGAAGAAGAAAAEKTYTFKEDRSTWVDPDRVKKAEAAINRTTTELERARAVIADQDRRIKALAGVAPVDPDAAEAQKIADAFFALPQFAHLKTLTPEMLQRVEALIAEGGSIAEARDHIWNAHTDNFLQRLDVAFADRIGADTLTPGQQKKLHAAFGAMIPDERDAEAFAAFRKRFEAGDESLITDFVKEYDSDLFEPVRRQATIPTLRRPVPRSGPAAPVVTQAKKPDYSQMTVEQMLEHGEKEAEALGR